MSTWQHSFIRYSVCTPKDLHLWNSFHKCRQGCGRTETLIYSWWKCKMVWPSSTDEWIHTFWYIHADCYSAIKRKKLLIHSRTWLRLKINTLAKEARHRQYILGNSTKKNSGKCKPIYSVRKAAQRLPRDGGMEGLRVLEKGWIQGVQWNFGSSCKNSLSWLCLWFHVCISVKNHLIVHFKICNWLCQLYFNKALKFLIK